MLENLPSGLRRHIRRLSSSSLHQLVLRAASGTLLVKVAGAGLAFVLQITLTRFLGSQQYGIYIYALTWAQLAALAGVFGFKTASVRFVSEYKGQQKWGHLRGFLTISRRTVLALSTGLALLFGLGAVAVYTERGVRNAFLVAALLPLAQSTMAVRVAELRGLKHVVLGYSIEQIVRPVLVIAGVAAIGWAGLSLLAHQALLIYVLGTAIAVGVAIYAGHRFLPQAIWQVDPTYKQRLWLRAARDMVLIAGFNLILFRADTLMVGALVGTEAAGLYAIASRVAGLLSFVIVAVNSNLGPLFADLHARNQHDDLRETVTFGARLVIAGSLVLSLLLYLFTDEILALFGPAYVQSGTLMRILILGQLANASAGPVMLLLNMTGHESTSAWIQGSCAALNIGLNAILITWMGAEGAAIATATTMVIWNGAALLAVRHLLNIDGSFIGWHVRS